MIRADEAELWIAGLRERDAGRLVLLIDDQLRGRRTQDVARRIGQRAGCNVHRARSHPAPCPFVGALAGYTGVTCIMRRLQTTLHAIAAIAAIAVSSAPVPDAAQGPALQRLNGVEELKSWFNAGVGHPRLIFLLSPT